MLILPKRNNRFVWNSSGKDRRKELETVLRQFNSKITRTANKETTSEQFLPDRIKAKDVEKNAREMFLTIQDYNRFIEEKKAFLKKGAEETVTNEKGMTKTKWEITQMKKDYAQNNRRKKIEHEKTNALKIMHNEKKTEMNPALYGSNEENKFVKKPFDFNKVKSESEWKSMKESVDKQLSSNYSTEEKLAIIENYYTA